MLSWVKAVRLPPGRLRLSTRPNLIGSTPTAKTIGIVWVAPLAARTGGVLIVAITATLRRTQVGGQAWQLVVISIRPSIFNHYIPTFLVAGRGEALSERRHKMRCCVGGCGIKISNHRHCALLRTSDERPRRGRAAGKPNKFAPSHSPS